tara:strand:+ start:4241 stop:6181 length:1941 start_codon:yes stop_codon:yes gene_type:complete
MRKMHILPTILMIFVLGMCLAVCSKSNNPGMSLAQDGDANNSDDDTPNGNVEDDLILIPWEQDPPEPDPECIECKWYFCPPLDEIWKKEICMNICEEPPTLYSETDCIQYLECDPSQYVIEEIECITEDGKPGTQQKVCNKGLIQYTDCITDCEEESCDYEDNDCDGEIDEGQLNACDECGIIPPEECNAHDDDCDGEIDEGLIQPCSTACGSGYEICSIGNWISCTAPPVSEEICDGLDNDCDGQIDEELDCVCTIQDIGVLFPCQEDPLLCGQGYKTCECVDPDCKTLTMTECYALCHWIPPPNPNDCDPLVGMALADEKCNNFDDDCDQEIDEDLYAACYTGPEGTLMVGICEPGEMTCDTGTWGNYDSDENFVAYYCKDEVTPQEEICNGLDDNCDGITDWGEEMKETDVLFIIDWSGSMSDEIGAVMVALNQFAQNFSDEDVIKWSFIRGPVGILPPPNQSSPQYEQLQIYQNLIGFSDFLNAMSLVDSSATSMNTAFEMLLDAIYLSVQNITANLPVPISYFNWTTGGTGGKVINSNPDIQNFNINWRAGADRVIIVFSDEGPQSYLDPDLGLEDVKSAVAGTPQLRLYTFSRAGSDKNKWEQIANSGNGEWYKLTNNPTEMYANLMEILDDICKGGSDE